MPFFFTSSAGDARSSVAVIAAPTPTLRTAALNRVLGALDGGQLLVAVIDPDATLSPSERHMVIRFEAPRIQLGRAALRQDPDALVLDLVDTADLADLVASAALTGHLVVAALDAPSPDAARAQLAAWVPPHLLEAMSPVVVDAATALTLVTARTPPRTFTLAERYDIGPVTAPPRARTLLQAFTAALSPHERTAWRLVTDESDARDAPSSVGGVPWLGAGEARPSVDGAPLFCALQLDVTTLPEALARELALPPGLLQVFRALDPADDDGDPFSPASFARVLPDLPGGAPRVRAAAADVDARYPARRIVDVVPVPDYPHSEQWAALGIALDDDDLLGREFVQRFLPEHVDAIVDGTALGAEILAIVGGHFAHYGLTPQTLRAARRFAPPLLGDKLLGWPAWEQGVATPHLEGRALRPLLQIEFDEANGALLPSLIASDGRAHLFVDDVTGRFALPWACG